MSGRQGDLFSGGGVVVEQRPPRGGTCPAVEWHTLDDERLIAALPDSNLAGSVAITEEIARRKLAAAIPELARLCRRFSGFGLSRVVPEQAAALDALATIGGNEAAQAVARQIAQGAVQGPGLKQAVRIAAALGSRLPPETLPALLRHDDPEIRVNACRSIGTRAAPETIRILVDLLDDLHSGIRQAASCALGRSGRQEARDFLIGFLRQAPSIEIIEALTPIADEECIILLARLAQQNDSLSAAILEALDAIDHPLAEKRAAALRKSARGPNS